MEQIVCSETSAYIIQTPGNYPKENNIFRKRRKFEIKKLSLFRLCDSDFGITPVDDVTIVITCAAFCLLLLLLLLLLSLRKTGNVCQVQAVSNTKF